MSALYFLKMLVRLLVISADGAVIAEFHRAVLEQNAVLAIIGCCGSGQRLFRCHALGHGFGIECIIDSKSILD